MRMLLLYPLLLVSLSNYGQTTPEANLLFNAFKQGNVNGGGNCASIALIKASIGTFGVGNVFSYTRNDKDSSITAKLRNDSTFNLTYNEIRQATLANGFVSKLQNQEAKNIKKYSDTCFAVMVKMNELIWEYDSYSEALTALLNGYNTPNVYRLLGVRFREISTNDLSANTNIVTYNSYHAVYSSFGYYDETKSAKGYALNSKLNNYRFGYKCSLYGCKPKRAFIIE